ncbi:MAG: hypothetical protein NVSMB6_24410 [Burkholderiaceae bacterium]
MPTTHARVRWDTLPDDLQLDLAGQALLHAAEVIAGQAECLAGEMESGMLSDRGGPEALRLLAAVVRGTTKQPLGALRH